MVCTPELSLRGGRRPTWRPEREARGSALGVQSRSTQPDNRVLPANTAALRDGASRTPPPTRRVRSAGIPGNLQLPKALTERRYRRNRLVRFYRHLVRTGSAFPRLPRRFAPRNDNSEVHTILTMACTDRQHCAGPGCPLPYNARPKACVFFILHFSVFRIHFHAPAPLQRTVGGPAKNSTLRVSRFLPQIFPFLCITACTGGETCCGEGQHAWNRSCAVCPTGPTRAR